jgi:hypothetical protein
MTRRRWDDAGVSRWAVRLHILHHAAVEEIHGAWLTEELGARAFVRPQAVCCSADFCTLIVCAVAFPRTLA